MAYSPVDQKSLLHLVGPETRGSGAGQLCAFFRLLVEIHLETDRGRVYLHDESREGMYPVEGGEGKFTAASGENDPRVFSVVGVHVTLFYARYRGGEKVAGIDRNRERKPQVESPTAEVFRRTGTLSGGSSRVFVE